LRHDRRPLASLLNSVQRPQSDRRGHPRYAWFLVGATAAAVVLAMYIGQRQRSDVAETKTASDAAVQRATPMQSPEELAKGTLSEVRSLRAATEMAALARSQAERQYQRALAQLNEAEAKLARSATTRPDGAPPGQPTSDLQSAAHSAPPAVGNQSPTSVSGIASSHQPAGSVPPSSDVVRAGAATSVWGDEDEIRALLKQYTDARSTFNWAELRRMWPGAPESVRRARLRVQRETVDLTDCNVTIGPGVARAVVRCLERVRSLTHEGQPHDEQTTTTFQLLRAADQWQIATISRAR
jgi:hypothetical protein